MNRLLCITTTLLCTVTTVCRGQVSAVVYDLELRTPVIGADITVRPSGKTRTDASGRFTIDKPFKEITITLTGYEGRRIDSAAVTDTVWLLPNGPRLDEVVIIGHRPQIGFMKDRKRESVASERKKGNSLFSFDMYDMLDRKARKSKKRRKKLEKILKDY